MKCQILFYGENKKILLICRLLNLPIAWRMIILKCLCGKKKRLQNYAFPDLFILPCQGLSFDKATKIVLLEIYANKKQIERLMFLRHKFLYFSIKHVVGICLC